MMTLEEAAVSEQPQPNKNPNSCDNDTPNNIVSLYSTMVTLNDSSSDSKEKGRCTKKCTIITLAVFFLVVILPLVVSLPLALKNKRAAAALASSNSMENDDAAIDFAKRYTFIQTAVAPYSQPPAFVQQDSPQSQALQWLVYKDKMTRNINMDDTSSSDGVVDKIAQRYALLVFYYACGSVAWNSVITPFEDQVDVSECHFTHADQQQHPNKEKDIVLQLEQQEKEAPGMLVNNEDEATIVCNDDGEIVHLNLRMQGLVGPVPDEIGALTKLTTLDLGHNSLQGPIPRVVVEKLVNLEVLKLDSNYFAQEIPSDIGRLSNLSVLNLDNNADLTGAVPSSLAKLTKLRLLSLSSTEVAGPGVIDQLLSWPLLEELFLHHSFLSGTLPVDMSPLTNLLVLSLRDTLVGGAIPSSITKLTTLQLFDIGGPNLKGKIPNDIGKLTELYDFYIDAVNLSGTLPTSMGNMKKLKWLQVAGTPQLTGSIPTQIGMMTDLQSINFERTGITGTVPDEFGNLSNLDYLFLWGTDLTGNMPDTVCSDGLQLQYPCTMTCECCSYDCKLLSKEEN